jgi:XTP/dITP diphosphohydrolase
MVDYLGGAPGVYSARFAGEDGNDAKNNEKLMFLLKDVPVAEKTAKFVSVITLAFPDGKVIVARGECPGRIIEEPAGENGFGYDPLFVPDAYDRTFAQLTSEEKNLISHRAHALKELERQLKEMGY